MLSKKPIKEEKEKKLTTYTMDISDLDSSNILALRRYYRRNEFKYRHIYKYLVNLERTSTKQLFLRDLSVEILQEIAKYIPNKQIAMSFIISMVHINKKESIEKENKQKLEDGTISELKKQSKTKEIENIKKLGLKVAIKGNKIIEKIYNNEIKKLLLSNHKYLNNTYDWGNEYFLSWYIKQLNNFIYAKEFLGKAILIMLYKEKCGSYKNIFIKRLLDHIRQSNFYKSNEMSLKDSLVDFEKYLSTYGKCHIILNDECLSAYLSYEGRKDVQLQEKLSKKILKFKTKFTFVVATLGHKTDEFKKWGEGFLSYQNNLKKLDEAKGNKFKGLINTFSSVVVKDPVKYKELFEISTTKLIKAIFFHDVIITMEYSKKDMEELNNSKKILEEYISKIYQYLNSSNLLSANNFYKILSSFMILAGNSYNMKSVCYAKTLPRIISNYAKMLERYIKNLMVNNLLKNNFTEILKRIELLVIYYENNLIISKQEELDFSYDYYDKCMLHYKLNKYNLSKDYLSKLVTSYEAYMGFINIKNIKFSQGMQKLFFYFIKNNSKNCITSFTKLIKFLKGNNLLSESILKHILRNQMPDSNNSNEFNKIELFKYIHDCCIVVLDVTINNLELFCSYISNREKIDSVIEKLGKMDNCCGRTKEVQGLTKQYMELLIKDKVKKVSNDVKLKIFRRAKAIFTAVKYINNKKFEDLFFKFAQANNNQTIEVFAKLIKFFQKNKLLSIKILDILLCENTLERVSNKTDFFKHLCGICVKLHEAGKLNNKIAEMICDFGPSAGKINAILKLISNNLSLRFNHLLVAKIITLVTQNIKLLINNKSKIYEFFGYIEKVLDIINNIELIDEAFAVQLFTVLPESFEKIRDAVFSLRENNNLVKNNLDFIMKFPERAGEVAIIIVALSKFNLLNKDSKKVISSNAEFITFDFAIIFEEIAKCKVNPLNTHIMRKVFDHLFKNLKIYKQDMEFIYNTIIYLKEAKFFTIDFISKWLESESYKKVFWIMRGLIEKKLLTKDNFEQVLLLVKTTQGIDKIFEYLTDTNSLSKETLEKLIEISKQDKFKKLLKIIEALYEYNEIREKLHELDGAKGFSAGETRKKILLTKENYFELSMDRLLNVSNDVCEIFKLLSEHELLIQAALDSIYKKTSNDLSSFLKQLQDTRLMKNLDNLTEKIKPLEIKIINKVLGGNNFNLIFLLADNQKEDIIKIAKLIGDLLNPNILFKSDIKNSFEKIFLKLIDLKKKGRLQQFWNVITALRKYNKNETKIHILTQKKAENIEFSVVDYLGLSKFIDISKEICLIFKILGEHGLFNQLMLECLCLYSKTDKNPQLISEELQLISEKLQLILKEPQYIESMRCLNKYIRKIEILEKEITEIRESTNPILINLVNYINSIKKMNTIDYMQENLAKKDLKKRKKLQKKIKKLKKKIKKQKNSLIEEAKDLKINKLNTILEGKNKSNPEQLRCELKNTIWASEKFKMLKEKEKEKEKSLAAEKAPAKRICVKIQKQIIRVIHPPIVKKAKIRRKFIFFRELGKLLYRLFCCCCCCFCCFCCRKRKNRNDGNNSGKGFKNSYAKIVDKWADGDKPPNTHENKEVGIVIDGKKKKIIKKSFKNNKWTDGDETPNIHKNKEVVIVIKDPDEKTPLLQPRCSINNSQ